MDASGLSQRDPLQDYEDINHELKMYDEANKDKDGFFPLANRTQFAVLNKIDTLSEAQLTKLKSDFQKRYNVKLIAISAYTGKNIAELMTFLTKNLFEQEENNT